jgi:hypothetical protein
MFHIASHSDRLDVEYMASDYYAMGLDYAFLFSIELEVMYLYKMERCSRGIV